MDGDRRFALIIRHFAVVTPLGNVKSMSQDSIQIMTMSGRVAGTMFV